MGIKRKIISSALAVTMLASATVSVFASDAKGTEYTSDNGMYTAEKITHTEAGIKTNDGILDYAGNGVVTEPTDETSGDRAQSYSWSAIGYGDYMYIGTCANAMTTTLSFMGSVLGNKFDAETMEATLKAIFNGHFFTTEEDGGDPKGVLLKLNTKTGDVKLLMSLATTNTNCSFRNAVEYKDMLYFCGAVNGLPCVYQVNPHTDECTKVYQSISQQDFYKAYQLGISVGIRGISRFGDKLIMSFVGLDGAYITMTDEPSNPDSYEVIADMDDLFNYPAYRYCDSIYGGSIWDIAEYNNSIYVSICTGTPENMPDSNTMQSFAIVRGDMDENEQWSWTSVIGSEDADSKYNFGIDPERTRSGAANIYVYDGYLYIGEYNDEEIALEDILFSKNCNFVNANLEQSVNLYRMDKNEDIELVVGNADEMFPDGSLTGYGSGFDRNENQYIWRMQEFDGKLYVGTFDTSSLLEPIGQFTNGDILNMTEEEWASQVAYIQALIEILKSKQENPDEQISIASVDDNLTNQEAEEIVEIANDENNTGIVDEDVFDKLENIGDSINDIDNEFNKQFSEEFIKMYEELVAQLEELKGEITDEILKKFEEIISKELLQNMESFLICSSYLAVADRGFDLYTLDSDLNVSEVTTNGFGDPYNHGCRVFGITDQGLFLGTANPFYGTQVWNVKQNVLYDDYDLNRDGTVNIDDVTFLQKYIADMIDAPYEDFEIYADMNGDISVDVDDVTYLQQYLTDNL